MLADRGWIERVEPDNQQSPWQLTEAGRAAANGTASR